MAQLSVTESESIALRIVSKQTALHGASCQHSLVTYEIDGVQKTLIVNEQELDEATNEDDVVRNFMRLRKARGKAQAGVRIV